ncbi:MAG: hypothetical protein COY40_03000, partial [Alphaproteobacteria bacterium CG_4_10_14_0_8_um_filter_53_9]
APPPSGKKKIIILAVSGVVLVILSGLGAWWFLGKKGDDAENAHGDTLDHSLYLEVPAMTTNMLSDAGAQGFIKMRAMLEVSSEEDKAAATAAMPQLQDAWNTFLRMMRPEDVQGAVAVQRLKEGLLLRANQALAPVPVRQVVVTELLVQ